MIVTCHAHFAINTSARGASEGGRIYARERERGRERENSKHATFPHGWRNVGNTSICFSIFTLGGVTRPVQNAARERRRKIPAANFMVVEAHALCSMQS